MADGFDIKLLSQRTGIAEGKIKMILQRHKELRNIPYSFRSGRNRIFLPAMVVWLRQYEGMLPPGADTLLSGNKTLPKLPNGAQLREFRLMAEKKLIDPDELRALIGLQPKAGSNGDGLDRWAQGLAEKTRKKQQLQIEADKDQGKLFS